MDLGFLKYDLREVLGPRPLQLMAVEWTPPTNPPHDGTILRKSSAKKANKNQKHRGNNLNSSSNNNTSLLPSKNDTINIEWKFLWNIEIWHKRSIPRRVLTQITGSLDGKKIEDAVIKFPTVVLMDPTVEATTDRSLLNRSLDHHCSDYSMESTNYSEKSGNTSESRSHRINNKRKTNSPSTASKDFIPNSTNVIATNKSVNNKHDTAALTSDRDENEFSIRISQNAERLSRKSSNKSVTTSDKQSPRSPLLLNSFVHNEKNSDLEFANDINVTTTSPTDITNNISAEKSNNNHMPPTTPLPVGHLTSPKQHVHTAHHLSKDSPGNEFITHNINTKSDNSYHSPSTTSVAMNIGTSTLPPLPHSPNTLTTRPTTTPALLSHNSPSYLLPDTPHSQSSTTSKSTSRTGTTRARRLFDSITKKLR